MISTWFQEATKYYDDEGFEWPRMHIISIVCC